MTDPQRPAVRADTCACRNSQVRRYAPGNRRGSAPARHRPPATPGLRSTADRLAAATATKDKAQLDWLHEIVWAVEHDGRSIADVARVAGISRTQVRRVLAQAAAA